LRSATSADHWRRATSTDRGFGISRVRISGKTPFDSVDLVFPNGIALFCGLNGVGKTTFLRLLEGIINGRLSIENRCRTGLLDAGTAEAYVTAAGGQLTLRLGDENLTSTRAMALDPFDSCARIVNLGLDPNFSDLVDGVEGRQWSDADLGLASYVLGWECQLELAPP
jgi:hypothetical protein